MIEHNAWRPFRDELNDHRSTAPRRMQIGDYVVVSFPLIAVMKAHKSSRAWTVELVVQHADEGNVPIGYFDRPVLQDYGRGPLGQKPDRSTFETACTYGEAIDVETAIQQIKAYLGHDSATIQARANDALDEPLTARELEVLTLLVRGYSNRQIAKRLFVGVSTVKKHNSHIYSKLAVENRTSAVAHARKLGLAH